MKPGYTTQEIASIIEAAIDGPIRRDSPIRHLLTDSRQVTDSEHTLFFAIKTNRNDGHRFIDQLIAHGVTRFVVSEKPNRSIPNPDVDFLIVDDPLKALQQLTAFHRSRVDIPVIGITGSNGKTIVKEWLSQLLSNKEVVAASPKSFNSQIGVPLSVWQLNTGHSIALFEAGISQPGEMNRLEAIIRPTIGLITNIGEPHAANFESIQQKTEEKLLLFKRAQLLIYCRDHHIVHESITKTGLSKQLKTFSWGYSEEADLIVEKTNHFDHTTRIDYRLKSGKTSSHHFIIPFSDAASIENSLHCRALLHCLHYEHDMADQALAYLPAIEMRLELREGINNCSLINDSYSNDLNSLAVALDFLNQQKQHEQRTVILSDIQQSGRDEAQLYADVAQLLRAREVKRLITIGEAIGRHRQLFDFDCEVFANTEDFLQALNPNTFQAETILIKGARSFGFERIVARLEQKNHETILQTNLASLIHNLNFYRSKLKPGVKITAMVKAFSYGSGSFEVANALQFHGIDYLAVAYADEGFELRRAGITAPIMVMNPERTPPLTLIKHRLEPEVYSLQQLHQICRSLPEHDATESLQIHLKLETGMHRLGISIEEAKPLMALLQQRKGHIRVASIFSHLAGSDDASLDDFSRAQVASFDQFSSLIQEALPYKVIRHILNSAGIVRFADAQFDMVRLGLGLYGISPNPDVQPWLQNVNTLTSHISQIKRIKHGDSVGYNRRFIANKETTIAIAPIGYADGLSRSLGNSHYSVTIRGQKASLIGSISMDMCVIDITHIPDAVEGDPITIFGNAADISAMAKAMNTIPYEVLTGISRRVKRIYFEE